jgi:hypothetical protein
MNYHPKHHEAGFWENLLDCAMASVTANATIQLEHIGRVVFKAPAWGSIGER